LAIDALAAAAAPDRRDGAPPAEVAAQRLGYRPLRFPPVARFVGAAIASASCQPVARTSSSMTSWPAAPVASLDGQKPTTPIFSARSHGKIS